MIPCESAAFRRMPAFFIAAVRSEPCGIVRASSSAACASASKSSSGRVFLAMVKKLRHRTSPCLSGPRHCGFEVATIIRFELVPGAEPRGQVARGHLVRNLYCKSAIESGIGQTHENLRVYRGYSHSTVGLAMQRPSDTQISPLRQQAADALRRARKLPVGHARNNLRQLASGLLWLEKRNPQAGVQDRVTAILALTDLRS
jgi:hypothetical protein